MVKIQCKKCNKEPATNLPHLGPLCREHFCEIVESRIRKNIRISYSFDKNDRILTTEPLTEHLVKKIIGSMPAKVINKNINIEKILKKDKKTFDFIKKNKINKIVIPWTADDECCLFLEFFFYSKKIVKVPYVKMFLTATDDEIGLFSKLNKIEWKKNKKDEKISRFIDELDKSYPQTKFSLLKSALMIEGVLNEKG